MAQSELYSDGSRRLQDRFDTRRIADRLEKVDLILSIVFDEAELDAALNKQNRIVRADWSTSLYFRKASLSF